MIKMHLLFSHKLTAEQISDAQQNLSVTSFIPLPEHLQKLWSQISPTGELPENLTKQFIDYLSDKTSNEDYVLIQGEFGITVYLVNWCLNKKRTPVYATSKRISTETLNADGSIKKTNFFKHIQFRKYR